MKHILHSPRNFLVVSIIPMLVAGSDRLQAADTTWDGGGEDNFWQTGANWDANAPPSGNDWLFFTGTTRLNNTNNFTAGTTFNGITFNSPAGAFALRGNPITLGGGITNNQVVTIQTINLPLALTATRNVNVTTDAWLSIDGVISGADSGMVKTGGGRLTLGAVNTFGGTVMINGGALSVAADLNLGAAPASPAPGKILLDGGALETSITFTLNTNRGLAVGPASGSGSGRVVVAPGTTLTCSGAIANNGAGTGGLTKGGFGTLTLAGANAYTGPTSNRVGRLFLDFSQATAPASDMIPGSSRLSLGGENAGIGTVNTIQLAMNSKGSGTSSQTFNGTFIDLGGSLIRVTNSPGGIADLKMGTITPGPGGAVTFITPTMGGGTGSIKTTSTNLNGILGGWATISGAGQTVNSIVVATNWASVDSNGNIVPYNNFVVYSGGNLAGQVTARDNVAFNSSGGQGSSVLVDADHDTGAGTTIDVNTITINAQPSFGINIGSNNVLRLGRYGGVFLATVPSTANNNYEIGNGTDPGNNPGANATQNLGTLTAGGAPDTPGQLVFTINSTSQTGNGSIYVETAITDNGPNGPVTVIKTGPGPMKFRGHNSFSGGMYIIQGRIQMAGSELPGGAASTANPDAFGTGPIYVLPGGQAFPSGSGGNTNPGLTAITNDWFIAGNGVSDNVGAIRLSGVFSNGIITLIGDARLGGGGFATGVPIYDRITGSFSLDFGATGNSGTGANGAIIYSQSNDWSGNTTIVGRTGVSAGNTRLILGNHEVIPDGFGKGNLILGNTGNTASQCVLDLNGFNETVNGLSSFGGTESLQFIQNGAASTTSTLTVGNNDQSGTFGGTIRDNSGAGGTVALTKIGGGILTLTGANAYTGDTTVNGGTLAVSESGSIASSANVSVNNGATLDMSGVSGGFIHPGTIGISNASLIVRTTTSPGISTLNLTDARVRVTTLGATNVETTSLTTGGATNRIDIISVGTVQGYPVQFTIIKYTGNINGTGFNFGLGTVPNAATVGYISNNLANSSVDLVLLDGPKPLTWTGAASSDWDTTTTNWLAFGVTPIAFLTADSVLFNDTSSVNDINLTATLFPAALVVSNATRNYTFVGDGSLSGFADLQKHGAGTLTLANSGVSDFSGGVTVNSGTVVFATDNSISGGVTINGGTVQVGTNGVTGSLPSGSVVNQGALVFNRNGNLTAANAISGSGGVTQNSSGVLTLSGASSYSGPTTVAAGTLRAGSAAALGDAATGTTVSSGATLDVNGQSLGAETVTVSGAGVGGQGAIVNTGAGANNALRNVTLAGDVTFGGTGRWDIRESAANTVDATLSATDLLDHRIAKIGANQVSLAGVQVLYLGDLDVQGGIFSVETGTTSLGNPTKTLTVASGATLQLVNAVNTFDKLIVLNGDGVTSTLNCGAGIDNALSGTVTLNGNCVISGAAGAALTTYGSARGTGSATKTGAGTLTLGGATTYTGSTVVSGGALFVDGAKTGGGGIIVNAAGTLAGVGSISEPVTIAANGTLSPGNATTPTAALRLANSLNLAGTVALDVFKSGGVFFADAISNVTTLTFGGTLQLNMDVTSDPLATGDVIKLFDAASYAGSFSNIQPATPGAGLAWDVSSLAVNGTLKVVDAAPPAPEIEGVTVSGSNIVISGTGGAPGGTYYVLTSTNVALPLADWTRVTTNLFDGTGSFSATNAVDPNAPQRFYLLQLQ